MSHHLDSPLARQDSRLDLTDLYLFPGTQGLTMIMNANSSLYGDHRRAGFHPEGRYEFKIHINGMAYEQVTYRFVFDPVDSDATQAVRLYELTGDNSRRDHADGRLVAQGRTGSTVDCHDGRRFYAGEVADPFYLDLRLLAAMDEAVQYASVADLDPWLATPVENTFAGSTVESIVLELPADGPFPRNLDLAVWSVAKLATDDGGWHPVNRTAIPMMWPIFRPDDSDYASGANEIHPAQDSAVDGKRIAELVAGVAGAYGTADPDAYGEALAARLLPDLLPYRAGTPAGLTFAGTNGRVLADNAPEVMFSLVANAAVDTRIRPQQTEATRQAHFPYVVPV